MRPLPPGRVRCGGSYTPPGDALILGDLALTWAHRDRLTQTSSVIEDFTAASIGPEAGTDYVVEVRWVDPVTELAVEPAAATIDAGTGTSFTFEAADVPLEDEPDGNIEIEISVRSRRDGLLSREARGFRFLSPSAAGWGGPWGIYWGG
jgi:hypothetical protein